MSYSSGELKVFVPGVSTDRISDVRRDEFGAWLPHSCDEWVIGVGTKDEVKAALEELIYDAQEALDRLVQS